MDHRPEPTADAADAVARPGSHEPGHDVQVGRWALIGLFAVNGFTLSAWLSRLPAVRDALGLTPGELGSVLLAASIGGIVTMSVAPHVVSRLGQGGSIRLFSVLMGVAYLLMGVSTVTGSLPLLATGLFINGMGLAGHNLTINLGSTIVERRVGRPVVPQFHAAFSIGTVVGSLTGAAAAAVALPLPVHFTALAAIGLGWRLLAARVLLPDDSRAGLQPTRSTIGTTPPGQRDGARSRVTLRGDGRAKNPSAARADGGPRLADVWREQRTLIIGAIILAAVISEFAANDWLALAVVDGRGASESVAAAMLALFLGGMTVVRLLGTPILNRFGRVAALRTGAVVSIAGVLVFVLAPTLPLAALGTLAWGAGCALNFPIAVSASSDDPAKAAHRISVLSVFASVAPLLEPAGIGLLADQVGVRYALLAVAVVLVVIVSAAGRVAPEHTVAASAGPVQRPSLDRVDEGRDEPLRRRESPPMTADLRRNDAESPSVRAERDARAGMG